jgi:hypothetical protein
MTAKSKGLSNSGQDALAKVGFTLQSKTFGQLEALHLQQQQLKVQQQLSEVPHVWWIDNYNCTYGQMFYKLSAGPIKVLNWTGWAFHCLPTNLKHRLTITSHQPLVPEHLQTYLFTVLCDLLPTFTTQEGTMRYFFSTSFCEVNGIYNVPLKPYKTGPQVSASDLDCLDQHLDGLVNFIPVKLMEHNVGSDVGLGNVLFELSKTYELYHTKQTFSLCKVDINIFWRVYLVSCLCQKILEYYDTNHPPPKDDLLKS